MKGTRGAMKSVWFPRQDGHKLHHAVLLHDHSHARRHSILIVRSSPKQHEERPSTQASAQHPPK